MVEPKLTDDPDSDEEADTFFANIALNASKFTIKKRKSQVVELGKSTYLSLIQHSAKLLTKEVILRQHRETGVKFTDPHFPPEKSSLIKDWNDWNNIKIVEWKRYTWKRAEEIYPQPIRVFNEIDPNDILQGELGDCYFLSSLSAIAEHPERIQRLFETPEYEPSGCYKIWIGDLGERQQIIIDDYFPINNQGEVAFSRSKREADRANPGSEPVTELWVLLLEKAWAKKFGAYYTIDAGMTNDALSDLTGAPCRIHMLSPERAELIWETLKAADEVDYIIAAGSNEESGKADLAGGMGLVALHAYAVLGVKEVSTDIGLERILDIRNPWGDTEWTGDWSDTSPKWTEALKQELHFTQANDGTFWMPYDMFQQYFSEVCICKVHDAYVHKSLKLTHLPGAFSVVKVSVAQPTHLFLTVCQVDERIMDDPGYSYSDVRFICARLHPDLSLEYLTGKAKSSAAFPVLRDEYKELNLESGDYLIFIQLDFPEDSLTTQFGVCCYSSSEVQAAEVTCDYDDFLEKVFTVENAQRYVSAARVVSGLLLYNWSLAGDGSAPDVFQPGYLADIYLNQSEKVYEVTAFHRSFENVNLQDPFDGEQYHLVLRAGESKCVVKQQYRVGEPFAAEVKAMARTKR